MRIVVAKVVKEFNLVFGEGYHERVFLEQWKDHYWVKMGHLEMKFVPRSR